MGSALTRSPGAAASPAVTPSAPVKERPPGRDKGAVHFPIGKASCLLILR